MLLAASPVTCARTALGASSRPRSLSESALFCPGPYGLGQWRDLFLFMVLDVSGLVV